ncbi:MAG: DUF1127 domain-containing protein [Pseudomonadota bacterium]
MKMHAAMIRSTAALRPAFSLAGMIKRALLAYRVSRERHDLADLAPHLLDDIGVTEADVSRETGRAFWDLPAGR